MKKDFVYLASASPRRSELLRQIGVPFEVRPAQIIEAQASGEVPDAFVLRLAAEKADAVWRRVPAEERRPVLAADTAVVLDERVLGKPADEAEAEAMLAALSGRTHRVLTAVALRCGDTAETLAIEQRSEISCHDAPRSVPRTVAAASRSTRRVVMESKGGRRCSSSI